MKEFASWKSFRVFAKTIRYEKRYLFDQEMKIFLDTLIYTRKKRTEKIPKNSIYWRAQLGCQLIPSYERGKHLYDLQLPYSKERMKPIPNQATEGRANPAGIPYLYAATDEKTALAEVRPWIGSEISLAQLRTVRNTTLINCSNNGDSHGYICDENPSPEVKEQRIWANIDRAFSRPLSPEERSTDYIPIQIIAELFRNHGYDGILYKSTLGNGLNVVLFDISCAEIVECQLYNADRINFEFSKISDNKVPTLILRNV